MSKHARVTALDIEMSRSTAHPSDLTGHAVGWNPDDTTRIFLPNLTQAMPQRVLVVDDDALMRERLEALVMAAGFEVNSAASGREALEILRRD
jgi:PleD family two-component response regulator